MMLAIKDILHSGIKFLLTGLGIGLLTAGTLTINGIYNGVVADSLNLVDRVEADLWVFEEGTEGPLVDASQVGAETVEMVRAVEGVADARRFDLLSQQLTVDGKSVNVAVLAMDYPSEGHSWLPLIKGRSLAALRGEALVDRSSGIPLGSSIELGTETVQVVGWTQGLVETNGEPIIVVSSQDFDAIRAQPSSGRQAAGVSDPELLWPTARTISAVLVDRHLWASPVATAERIRSLGDFEALTSEQHKQVIIDGRLSRMRLQILIFSGLLTVITAVVVTLTIYTMTLDKQHTIALLKLVGASPGMVAGLIVSQAALLAVLGILAGLALQQLLVPLFPRRVLLQPLDLVLVGGAVLLTGLAGSAIGIWKASRVRAQEILS
ncbi:FtsX-like permease family protein [Devosia sp. FKR38]|uniref:ABC transporter permease n=1 Tax=Devosia sp. FKR38 TaxID=2562312 RepID=UPI0010C064BB|nr:FtsX-like permease family protein [Devosia sp. FKR38]